MPPIAQPANARTPQIPTRSSQALRMFRAAISATPYGSSGSPSLRPSSSSSPRGGQSSFCGASQRLEQWSEAMFCSGTRMWPFSSMCATSST